MSTPYVSGDATPAQLATTLNDVIRELQAIQRVQIFKDEAGTRRVILDKNGLRTSPAGTDVFTAADDVLTFNSNRRVFKIVDEGTTTVTSVADDIGVTTIAHGLSYVPMIFAFMDDGVTSKPLPTWTAMNTDTVNNRLYFQGWLDCASDATNIYFQHYDALGSSGTEFAIKYYLLQESAN